MGVLTFASLGYALLINVLTFIPIVFVFNFLRTFGFTRMFYSPKRRLNIPFRLRPPRLPALAFWKGGFFSALWIDDHDFVASAGHDALTYVSFLGLGFRMSVVIGVICLVIILPINWIGGDAISCSSTEINGQSMQKCRTDQTSNLSNFDYTTLANISNKSNLLWGHLIVAYIVTFVVMKMLWIAQAQAVEWRVRYLASTRKGAESHTILVQNIPGVLFGTVSQRIYDNLDSPWAMFIPKRFKESAKAVIEGGLSMSRLGVVGKVPIATVVRKGGLARATSVEALTVYTDGDDSGQAKLPTLTWQANAARSTSTNAANGWTTHENAIAVSALHRRSGPVGVDDSNTQDAPQALVPPAGHQQLTDFDTWAQATAALRQGKTVTQLVTQEFHRTYPEVESVRVVKSTEGLAGLEQQYGRTKVQLEDMMDRWRMLLEKGRQVKLPKVAINPQFLGEEAIATWGPKPLRIDKAEYLAWKLNHTYQALLERQKNAEETCSAFVTFRKRLTQVQAASALHYHNTSYWTTEPASGPQEIIWENLSYRGWERKVRFLLAWTIFALMTAFCSIPIAALQQFVDINHVSKLPGMSYVLARPFLRGLISGILPGLILQIFLAILPAILRRINRLQGIHSNALNDFEVGRKYFCFQYVQVFLVFVIGGTVLSNATQITKDTQGFIVSLGQLIPSSANFYITYTLVNAFITVPLGILRGVGLVLYIIQSLLCGSQRAKRRLWAQQYTDYGSDVPNHTLTVVFLFTFCLMSPFITIACALYFAVAAFVARYQLLYVFREEYQSGGRFQTIIFGQIFVALLTFQIAMFAVLSVKEFPYSPLVLILILLTFCFRWLLAASFDRPLLNLSAHAAADLDRADEKIPGLTAEETEFMMSTMDCEDTPLGDAWDLYLPPCFKVKAETHRAVLAELDDMLRKVAAVQAGRTYVPDPKPSVDPDDPDALDGAPTAAPSVPLGQPPSPKTTLPAV